MCWASTWQYSRWAAEPHAHGPQIGAWLARATDGMLGIAGVGAGSRVLDVAAGAGDQTLIIVKRVGPAGHVLATDLSPAILALARDNALRAGLDNVQTQVADGQDLRIEAGSFDAVVCRLGLINNELLLTTGRKPTVSKTAFAE